MARRSQAIEFEWRKVELELTGDQANQDATEPSEVDDAEGDTI